MGAEFQGTATLRISIFQERNLLPKMESWGCDECDSMLCSGRKSELRVNVRSIVNVVPCLSTDFSNEALDEEFSRRLHAVKALNREDR